MEKSAKKKKKKKKVSLGLAPNMELNPSLAPFSFAPFELFSTLKEVRL
jgi:hypothetical protein